MHHKGKKIPFNIVQDSIGVYEPLGLSIEEIERSVDATIKMFKKLSDLLGNDTPQWVTDTCYKYLRVEFTLS